MRACATGARVESCRLILAVLALALWWPGASGQTLTIGRQDGDGIQVEVSVEVVREAFRLAGLNLAFRRLPLARLIEAANEGEVDGDLQRIGELPAEFSNLVRVPTPINRSEMAVYGVSPDLRTKSRADITRMRCAIQRSVFALVKHTQGMSVTGAQTTVPALEMVRNGHADVAILIRTDAEVRIRQAGMADVVRWPHLWAVEPLYLWLHRKNVAHVAKLNEALQQLQRQGFIDRAYADMLRRNSIPPMVGDAP